MEGEIRIPRVNQILKAGKGYCWENRRKRQGEKEVSWIFVINAPQTQVTVTVISTTLTYMSLMSRVEANRKKWRRITSTKRTETGRRK